MGLLLTNAWRIESSSVRLYTNLRSWPFFWCLFHKREPMGEWVRICFLHYLARFLVFPRLRVFRTHTGQKNNQKTASYPGYLYTSGGTPPHGLLVPIRLLWLVPVKKAVHFDMRKPYSIFAATLQWPTGVFLSYFTKFENDHSNQLRRRTVRQTKNVCQMSCLWVLKWP